VSDAGFRVIFVFVDGTEQGFPVSADAAREGVKRGALWREAPVPVEVIDKLDNREILLAATVRVYTHIARTGTGTYWMTDEDGREWGILARFVRAVRVEDPEATDRKGKKSVGFAFESLDPT
jgi:hypothetical protein